MKNYNFNVIANSMRRLVARKSCKNIAKIFSYLLFVAVVVGCAGGADQSDEQTADQSGKYILVSRKDDVVHAKSAKTQKTLFEHSDPKEVIEWAIENGDITVLEPGTYTVTDAVRISKSNVSLIIKEGATLRMPEGTGSSFVSEWGGYYYPLIYVAPSDVFTRSVKIENVSVINFGTLEASGKTPEEMKIWGGGACIIYDGRKWDRTCGLIGGTIFSSGTLTGSRGATLWIVDSKATKIPLMAAEDYNNGVIVAEGCEDLDIGIVAGLAGEKAEENETIDLNYYNRNVHMDLIIGSAPSEEVADINNSINCTVDKIVGYGAPNMKLLGTNTYKNFGDHLTYKKPIKESVGTAVKEQKVVDKKVKNYRQVVEVPQLPESLPNFTVKAKLIVEFEDGTQEVAYDKTIPINLGESE
jgi:hypothetical protein